MRHRALILVCLAIIVVAIAGCGGSSPTGSSPTSSLKMQAKAVVGDNDFLMWDENKNNPVVGPSANGAFPCVVQHGGLFRMWTDNDSFGGIYYQESTDGKSWSTPVSCNLANGRHARVIFNETSNLYEMWYWDRTSDFSITSFRRATSQNGINWSNNVACSGAAAPNRPIYAILLGPGIGSNGPCQVFYNAAGSATVDYTNVWQNRYVMYYHVLRQADSKNCIGICVSADGLKWGVPTGFEGKVVLDVGQAGSWDSKSATFGSIIRDGSGFHMYYAGGRYSMYGGEGIGYASSGDGLVWTKEPQPLLSIGDGVAWRSVYIGPPAAILGDVRMLYIYSYDGYSNYSVGLAMPDMTPPVISLDMPSDNLLSPPNDKVIPVRFGGSAVDEGVGLRSASLTVEDEYGIQNQTIDLTPLLDASGRFSQTIDLRASCNLDDTDGHQYRVVLNAVDLRNNVADPFVAIVLAGPNTLQPPAAPGNGNGNGNGYGIGNGNAGGNGNGNGHVKK
ncbi:MAG: hypothetical protein ACM3VW_07995 [Bacteroidota bacterium]